MISPGPFRFSRVFYPILFSFFHISTLPNSTFLWLITDQHGTNLNYPYYKWCWIVARWSYFWKLRGLFPDNNVHSSHTPGRPPRAPGAFTWCRRRRSAVPHAHPVLTLGHSSSGTSGDVDCHRPSGRCNAAVWISGTWWKYSRRRRDPTAVRATTWGAMRWSHTASMEHRAAWGWGHKTRSMGGGEMPRASKGNTWWSTIVCGWCQMGSQCEGWRQYQTRCWWGYWFWDWKLMNHLGLDYEDTLGNYIGSSDGITYGKNMWFYCYKIPWLKGRMRRWGIIMCSMKLRSRRRMGVNLTLKGRRSSLARCRKGGALVHTPWYPNLQWAKGELTNQLKPQLILVSFVFSKVWFEESSFLLGIYYIH